MVIAGIDEQRQSEVQQRYGAALFSLALVKWAVIMHRYGKADQGFVW